MVSNNFSKTMKYFKSFVIAALATIYLGCLVYATKVELPLQYCEKNETCEANIEYSYCDFDKNLQCGVGVCRCLSTHFANISNNDPNNPVPKCLPIPWTFPASCQSDIECTSSFGELSYCLHSPLNSSCQCKDDSIYCPNQLTCQPRLELGDSCICDNQCNHLPNAECRLAKYRNDSLRCQCSDFYMLSPDGTSCMWKANELGQSCDIHPDQCSGIPNSICDADSKTCICDPKTSVPSYYRTTCHPLREHLNMPCWDSSQCLPENSTCEYDLIGGVWTRYCGCDGFYFITSLKENKCLSKVYDIGESCVDNIQCNYRLGENAECSMNDTCQCKQGYSDIRRISSKYGACWPIVLLNGYCDYSKQCVDGNGSNNMTTCQGGICKCNSWDSGEFGGICYNRKFTGESCELSVECKASIKGPVLCNKTDNTCTCDDKYVPSNDKMSCVKVK